MLQSIQDGHQSIDLSVQNGVQHILESLATKFSLQICVVIDGLRPKCAASETASLTKSKAIWDAVKDSSDEELKNSPAAKNAVFRKIMDEYGSRFYIDEIINAVRKVKGCEFFIAPFNASAQLAQFF